MSDPQALILTAVCSALVWLFIAMIRKLAHTRRASRRLAEVTRGGR